jgi:hypothetical protein
MSTCQLSALPVPQTHFWSTLPVSPNHIQFEIYHNQINTRQISKVIPIAISKVVAPQVEVASLPVGEGTPNRRRLTTANYPQLTGIRCD